MKRRILMATLSALLVLSGFWPKLDVAQAATNTGTACISSAQYDASTNGTTSLITGNAAMKIYICGFVIFSAGTVNVSLVYGTGSSCTSSTSITPAFQLTAQTGLLDASPQWRGLPIAAAGKNVCIVTTAGVAVQAIVYYAVAP